GKQMVSMDTYDAFGRAVKHADTPSNVPGETFSQTFGYDAYWDRNSIIDAKSNTTAFCFDGQGNILRVVGPSAFDAKANATYHPVTQFAYDSSNNLTQVVPPEAMGNQDANATNCGAVLTPTAGNSLYQTIITPDNAAKPHTVTVSR